jgi:hypothetical protein
LAALGAVVVLAVVVVVKRVGGVGVGVASRGGVEYCHEMMLYRANLARGIRLQSKQTLMC